MNLHFIGKEFVRLEKLEDIINYQYEPKSNKRFGKRNIYFDDLKLDFINEVSTYGFSPFILKNFGEQRDDPNIMRYMTKKFNHGLTNYIKLKTHAIARHTSQEIKKYISQKKKKFKKNKKPKKISNPINSIYLIKKNEEKKVDEVRENFLQKALQNMGGYKLNLSMDEEEENKEKEKENKQDEENTENEENTNNDKDQNIINKNDVSSYNETKKSTLLVDTKKKILKKNTQNFPNIFSNNFNSYPNKSKTNNKTLNLKFEEFFENNKKVPYSSKNKDLNRKSVFSSKNRKTLGNFDLYLNSINIYSTNKNINTNNYLTRYSKKKKIKKNEFLLFTKARPYRYMTSEAK